ncbi:hypothetical protein L7F22_012394 [Adiantum nelumboides]|nr:hypothetical protein [Adiantum nelumboides]
MSNSNIEKQMKLNIHIRNNRMATLSGAMTLFLAAISLLQLVVLHQHAAEARTLASTPASASLSSVQYWAQALPAVALPAELRERVTALDGSNAAVASQLYQSLLGGSSDLCAAAHLYCDSKQFDAFRLVLPTCSVQFGFRKPDLSQKSTEGVVSFFRESELVAGAQIALGDQLDRAPTAPFLPRHLASALHPASAELLQTAFGIPAESLLSKESLHTSKLCVGAKEQLLEGEEAFCALSLEDLADQLKVRFAGQGKQKMALLPVSMPPSAVNAKSIEARLLQVELRAEAQQPYLACHAQTYPFAVHFCHHIPDTRIYSATLQTVGAQSEVFQAVAICHSDTREWSPKHTAFADLHSAPGLTEACHWTHQHGLVFVPAA